MKGLCSLSTKKAWQLSLFPLCILNYEANAGEALCCHNTALCWCTSFCCWAQLQAAAGQSCRVSRVHLLKERSKICVLAFTIKRLALHVFIVLRREHHWSCVWWILRLCRRCSLSCCRNHQDIWSHFTWFTWYGCMCRYRLAPCRELRISCRAPRADHPLLFSLVKEPKGNLIWGWNPLSSSALCLLLHPRKIKAT